MEQIDTLINKDPNRLMKLAFECFDFNEDGFIDEVDIYCVMKLCDLTATKAQEKKLNHGKVVEKKKEKGKGNNVFEGKDEVDFLLERKDNLKAVMP